MKIRRMMGLMLAMIMAVSIFSCSDEDDDDGIRHDDSKMMALMHANDKSMDSLKMTNDPDDDFAMMMRVHHKGAIDMGNLELKEGKDTTLQRMTRKMIADQRKEIAELDSFLLAHDPVDNEPKFSQEAMMAMDKMQKEADGQFLNGNTDHDFAVLMIQHHEGAIEMSESLLRYGNVEKMKQMARMMIDMQKKEIEDLKKWLAKY